MRPEVRLGAFVVETPIGAGGMGRVWSARHVPTGQRVAVKLLRRGAPAELVAAFVEEVRLVAQLDHPRIVTLLDEGRVGLEAERASGGELVAGAPYLVMELASAGTLADVRGPSPWGEVRLVLLTLLDALAHAHARGVLHRDLTPGNVLRTADGGLLLSDFGVARPLPWLAGARPAAGRDEAWAGAGTPAFMAPEQVRRRWRDQGPWTDLYALGAIGWKLVTGEVLFAAEDAAEVMRRHLDAPLPPLPPGAPDGLGAWLARMLAKVPYERFSCAAEAAAALPAAPAVAIPTAFTSHTFAGSGLDPGATDGAAQPGRALGLPAGVVPRAPPRLPGVGLGLLPFRVFPFVGREVLRDGLWAELERVRQERRPRVVVLRGPRGVGKRRLAQVLAQRAVELGVAGWLAARHDGAGGRGDGLAPMFGRFFRCEGLSGEPLSARLAELRGAGVPGTERPDELAALLSGRAWEDVPAGEGPRWRHRLVLECFRGVAGPRAQVVTLEDLHHGPDSASFLAWLMRTGGELPVLFVGTVEVGLAAAPGEGLDELTSTPGVTTVDLEPLGLDELEEMFRDHLSLDGGVLREVYRRSGGNPGFALEIVREWARRGALRSVAGGFVPDAQATLALPVDLRTLWVGAVERLLLGVPEGARRALHIAAVLAPEVGDDEWRAACRALGVVGEQAVLDALLRARLAEPVDGGWRFVHPLLVEVLAEQLRESGEWARVNAVAAELADAGPARRDRVGLHLLEAGRASRALDELLVSARRKLDALAFAEARPTVALLSERLLLHPDISPEDPRRGEVALLQIRAAIGEGRLADAERLAARAAEQARVQRWPALRARAVRYRGMALAKLGSLALAEAVFTQAELLAEQVGDEENLAACLEHRGTIARQQGELRVSSALLQEALVIYRRVAQPRLVADCAKELGGTLALLGESGPARVLLGEARAAYGAIGSRVGEGQCLNNLAELDRAAGRLAEAEAAYLAAFEALRDARHHTSPIPLLNLGLVRVERGDLEGALRGFSEALALAAQSDRRGLLLLGHAFRLAVYAATGAWSALREDLAAATRLTDETGVVDGEVATRLARAGLSAAEAGEAALAAEIGALAARHRSGPG